MNLDAIYASHPLSERTILARVHRQGLPSQGLREWDLAIDPTTEITDQNHLGGVEAVFHLAAAARIDAHSTVLDIGAGLGGSARVLAEALGCRVVGIERDLRRCEEATRLTSLVDLSQRVTFVRHDALDGPVDDEEVDVLWGQSAWVHFPDPEAFLDLWIPTLKRGGRIAMSDAHLMREPAGDEEVRVVAGLEALWGAHLTPIERWRTALEQRDCEVVHQQLWSDVALAHFTKLQRVSSEWPYGQAMPAEMESWTSARDALSRGLIGAYQLVAVRQ